MLCPDSPIRTTLAQSCISPFSTWEQYIYTGDKSAKPWHSTMTMTAWNVFVCALLNGNRGLLSCVSVCIMDVTLITRL